MRLALIALIVTAACYAQPTPACKGRVLIVTGQSDEPFHHWRETTQSLRETLAGRFEVIVNEEPRGLTSEALAGYQAVIVNYNGPRLPAAAEQALESFVKSGGGLFAFHLAAYGPFFGMTYKNGRWSDGDEGWTAWPAMIGARWATADIGHAARGPFEVTFKNNQSFTANDELYHKIGLLPGTTVEATALSPQQGGTGKQEPMIWTNHYGKGRVFFTTLGHDAMAFHQPGMRKAVLDGVQWATGATPCELQAAQPIRLLVVTGNHSYPVEFYSMLNSLQGVKWTHATSEKEAFSSPITDRYDVVLLHDMLDQTAPNTREKLRAFVDAGKGIISVHHAIVDYTDWPWWYQEVTGGKYFIKAEGDHPASHYREGVDFIATPVDARRNHPVLSGVGPLTVHDEVYNGMWRSPKIDVLMETAHPENDKPVVYIGPHPRARVLYIQLGHAASTMENPGFRRLIRNAVDWTARRTN